MRIDRLGLETVGIEPERQGVPVDTSLLAGDGVWAIGDVTGISCSRTSASTRRAWPRGDMLGQPAQADYRAVPRDRKLLVGAYAVGPEAGEWLQQATLAIRAGVPLSVLRDTIQPFPTFSEAFLNALQALEA